MAAGNRSVLVILDSRCESDRVRADGAVFAALEHFGAAHEVIECGDYWELPPDYVSPRAAYVLAHDGAGAGLRPEVAGEIAAAVKGGAGLLALDREMWRWPACLKALLPSASGRTAADSLHFATQPHFVTFGHEPEEAVELHRALGVTTLRAGEGFRSLVEKRDGEHGVVAGAAGDGRVVAFGAGNWLYADEVFGHIRGLDGLMWRALVWVAAKPFPMRCIPPFVSARMDDCNGTYGAFGYVETLNRYGIRPNLGLFTDEMGPTDWAAARRLYEQGGADFSMHAFRDDFYKASPKYKPYAVLADKPDLSQGGRDTRFEGLSLDHVTGRDLDEPTVKRNFERLDEAFGRAGIKHSRIINAHYGEIGWRAVPRFLERGADLPCNNSVVGQLYGQQPVWRPKPYGTRGPTGRYGLVIDRCPQHPDLMFVHASPCHLGDTHMVTDVLHGCTPFNGEASRPRLREAVARGIANVRFELDCLAFGEIMTHEERIDALSPEDWDSVVTGIVNGLSDWDLEFAGREHVSVICKRLFDSRLVYAECTDTGLHCELCGRTDGPSPLTIWENEGEGCSRRTVYVSEFEGVVRVEVEGNQKRSS